MLPSIAVLSSPQVKGITSFIFSSSDPKPIGFLHLKVIRTGHSFIHSFYKHILNSFFSLDIALGNRSRVMGTKIRHRAPVKHIW